MAMTDEERLQFAIAQELAAYTQERGPVTEYWDDAQSFIAQLRGRGITITPPPAPEPTYTIRLTATQHRDLITVLGNHASSTAQWFYERFSDSTPDPEPGA